MTTRTVRVVIWMNQPSYYQSVFFQELVNQGVELQVFYNSDLAYFRKSLGWQPIRAETFGQHVLSGPRDALRQALRYREAIHLVNGLWSIPSFILASSLLLLTGARVYFHAEHPDPVMTRTGIWYQLKCGWTRFLMSWAQGLFVIGRRAGSYYNGMGVQPAQLIPFMYFTSRPTNVDSTTKWRETGQFKVAYVGQFVEWKRVDDLIQAMAMVCQAMPGARLQLLGSGPLAARYLTLADELGLRGEVEVRGPLPPAEIWQALAAVDVVVLPSRFDGWGLTVNEALQSGAMAICSDGCGAAEILRENPDWGQVYPAGNIAALVTALSKLARHWVGPEQSRVASAIGATGRTYYFLAAIKTGPFSIY